MCEIVNKKRESASHKEGTNKYSWKLPMPASRRQKHRARIPE